MDLIEGTAARGGGFQCAGVTIFALHSPAAGGALSLRGDLGQRGAGEGRRPAGMLWSGLSWGTTAVAPGKLGGNLLAAASAQAPRHSSGITPLMRATTASCRRAAIWSCWSHGRNPSEEILAPARTKATPEIVNSPQSNPLVCFGKNTLTCCHPSASASPLDCGDKIQDFWHPPQTVRRQNRFVARPERVEDVVPAGARVCDNDVPMTASDVAE